MSANRLLGLRCKVSELFWIEQENSLVFTYL